MKKQTSIWLFWFSLWTLVCGLIVAALGVWNGIEVAWSDLSVGIIGLGGALAGLSALGVLASQGCTFCCNIGLYVFIFLMGILVIAQAGFIGVAAFKESEWVADLAKKHASADSVDHLKSKYDQFWPVFISFGGITIFGCIGAFLGGYCLLKRNKAQQDKTTTYIRDNERDVDTAARARHQEVGMQMQNKYGSLAKNLFKNKKGNRMIMSEQDVP